MNRNNNYNNLVPTSFVRTGHSMARAPPIHRTPIAPNPSIPVPTFPQNTIQYGQFFLQNMSNPHTKNLTKDPNSIFIPGNKVNAVEFANFVMSIIRNPTSQRALTFFPLSKLDSDLKLLREVNHEICSGSLFGIYSESPFLRPVTILRETKFAYPFNISPHFSDTEGLIRQLKDIADAKVNPHTFPTLCANPSKFNASNMGFATDYMTHSFNLELDTNLLYYLSEQYKREATWKGSQYRVVLRLGWATTPMVAAKTPSNARRLLTADQLPRSLTVKVGRRPVSLPDPAFHGGQATKLGHRLRYSIDITDKLYLRPLNLNRARNVEVEIGWVQAPLEDSGVALLEAVATGIVTPAVSSLINLPLIQITLDRVEAVDQIVKSFVNAKPGVPTGEAEYEPPRPGPLGSFSLPPFAPDKIFGLYQFCVSSERVIPKEATLKMLKSKLDNQDGIQCENSFPTSLNCPLTLMRLQIPVKSCMCTHVQCFDLEAFLRSVKCRPRWNCPVCKIAVPFRDLRRDELFEELLRDPTLSHANRIKIDASGRVIYIENEDGESQQFQNEQDTDDEGIGTPIKVDPGLSMATQPKKTGAEEVIVIDDSSDEEHVGVQQERWTNGGVSNGFFNAHSSGANIARSAAATAASSAAAKIQQLQQPPSGALNAQNNHPPPPPRLASPAFTQRPPTAAPARPILIPHRAPVVSNEVVDLTSDNEDEFVVPTTRVEPSRVARKPTTTTPQNFSSPAIHPSAQPQPPMASSAGASTPRTSYLVIPSTSQQADQPANAVAPASINVSNLAPRVITSVNSMDGTRYVLVPTTQSNPFPIPVPKSTANVSASATAVPTQSAVPPAFTSQNTTPSPHLASLLSSGSPLSTSTTVSQESTSGATGGGGRSSRFKSTAKRRTSTTVTPDVAPSIGTGTSSSMLSTPSDIHHSQPPLSAVPANLRSRTSIRLSSSGTPSPVATPSRNVARRGCGRNNAGGGKRRRVHLGDDDGSTSVTSSSTGAPSEDVHFGETDEVDSENFDSNQEDDDDDNSDDEWTPDKLNTSASSSTRRKATPSAASLLARRKATPSGAPSSDGSTSGSSRRT